MLLHVLLVALGAGVGGGARYGVAIAIDRMAASESPHFPWGVLVVNVTGALVMGACAPFVLREPSMREEWRLLLCTGILGGYTTMSAFAFDVLKLGHEGRWSSALLYIALTNALTIAAVALGYMLVNALRTPAA